MPGGGGAKRGPLLKRTASFVMEAGSADLRKMCFASYIALKLMDGSLAMVGTLLTMHAHPERKAYKIMLADFQALKVAHLVITLLLPRLLKAPVRVLVTVFISAGILFTSILAVLAVNLSFDLPLLPLWFRFLGGLLALLFVTMDAVTDSLCRVMGLHLQPVRKVGSLVVTSGLLVQLALPPPAQAVPLALVAATGFSSCIVAACFSLRAGQSPAAVHVTKAASDAGRLQFWFAALFMAAVIVGDNGEELLDQVSSLEIDKDLAGGKIRATVAKHVVSLLASLLSVIAFATTYQRRFASPISEETQSTAVKREASIALAAISLWGIFQGIRYVAVSSGALGHSGATALLVLLDKITGSGAADSFGSLQTLTLAHMAVHDGQGSRLSFSPLLAGSATEVVDKLSKAFLIRQLVDDESWMRSNIALIISVLTSLAVAAHALMAFFLVRWETPKSKTE